MKNIFVTNRMYAENGYFSNWGNDHIIISISDPSSYMPEIKSNQKCYNTVSLRFHDIDTRHMKNSNFDLYSPMTDDMADYVINSVMEYDISSDGNLDALIHCEAGLSRSAGVGCALEYIWRRHKSQGTSLETNTAGDFSLYNRYVYSKIVDAYIKNYVE